MIFARTHNPVKLFHITDKECTLNWTCFIILGNHMHMHIMNVCIYHLPYYLNGTKPVNWG